MNGKNHLVTGAVLAVDTGLALASISAARPVIDALSPLSHYGHGATGYAACAACAALYLFGTVLPDIDNGGLVSKWLHFGLPFAHRGWTHSVWAAAFFLLAGFYIWPANYIWLGMLAHDFMDALSVAGWVPFYPFGEWRVYKGVIMARGWTPSLYGSSSPGSENIVAGIFVLISVLAWSAVVYFRFYT